MTGAEIGVIWLQTQGHHDCCQHQSQKKARKCSSLDLSEGAQPCPKLNFEFLAFRIVGENISVVLPTQLVVICYSSHKKTNTNKKYLLVQIFDFFHFRGVQFFPYRSCIDFVRFVPKYLTFDANINTVVFFISITVVIIADIQETS